MRGKEMSPPQYLLELGRVSRIYERKRRGMKSGPSIALMCMLTGKRGKGIVGGDAE